MLSSKILAQEMRELADRLEESLDRQRYADLEGESAFKLPKCGISSADRKLEPPKTNLDGGRLWNLAKAELAERKLREKHLPHQLCEGGPWNILVDLLVCQLEGRTVSVTSACVASRAPNTTALRYIKLLVEEGWCRRVEDPIDRRRCWLELSEKAFGTLSKYYAENQEKSVAVSNKADPIASDGKFLSNK